MSSHFKYLGSIIQNDGEINSDINHPSRLVEMDDCNRSFT